MALPAESRRKKQRRSRLITLRPRRPSGYAHVEDGSQVENGSEHSPGEMPLQATATYEIARVPTSDLHVPTTLSEHPQPPSESGHESSLMLPEPTEHASDSRLILMKQRDSTRSTVGTVSSRRSRLETPELLDPESSPKTPFESPQLYNPPSPPSLPTSGVEWHMPPSPSHAGGRPTTMGFGKRTKSPGSRSSPNLIGASPTESVDTAAQPYRRIPRDGRVSFPSTGRLSNRTTMSRLSGFDPRSSTYMFIQTAINFSDPHLPDLNFFVGLDNGAIRMETGQGMLDHGDNADDGPEYYSEENTEGIAIEHDQSGDRRSRSLSAFMKTLSDASRGARSVFGTGGPGDANHSLPRNHHMRPSSTPFNATNQEEEMGENEGVRMVHLHEETMTDDGLGDDGYQVVADEGNGIPADPMAQANPTSPTFPTSPESPSLSTAPRPRRRLSLIPLPPPISQRTAPPTPIKFSPPPPPQAPIIATTAPSTLEDVPRSTVFPVSFPPLSPAETSPSVLLPRHQPFVTHRALQSKGLTANVAATASPNLDRSEVSASLSPQYPQALPILAPLPPPSPTDQPGRSPLTSQSLKLRFPTLGPSEEMSVTDSNAISRKRHVGGSRVDRDLVELRRKLKLPRKKDSGELKDLEPVVEPPELEPPSCAIPFVIGDSNSTTLGGIEVAAPDKFQIIGGTGTTKSPSSPPKPPGDESLEEGAQMLAPTAIPPYLGPSAQGDRTSDVEDQHLIPTVQGFHFDPLPPPDVTFGEQDSTSQTPLPHPHTADFSPSPDHHVASILVGTMEGGQDATPASIHANEFETTLRLALDNLTHLSVPPSRLTMMDSTEVGCGRYGEVLLAQLDGSSLVAVKELRPVETRGVRQRIALRLARELKIWAGVTHPNVLPLIGYYLSENYEIARFISPLMNNGNVSQYLKRAQLGMLQRLDIVRFSSTVDCSSRAYMLHKIRDITPNILINDNFQAVLCDFGLASFIQESGFSSGLTTSRCMKGSLRYMSPELNLKDDAKHTLASDVWAWGCTAFEIVTDYTPYQEYTKDTTLLLAVVEGKPPGSIELLISHLADQTSFNAPPAMHGLKDYIPLCWNFDAAQRPHMPRILDTLFPNMIHRTQAHPEEPDAEVVV